MRKYIPYCLFFLVVLPGILACQKEVNETIEGNLAIAPLPSAMEAGTGLFPGR